MKKLLLILLAVCSFTVAAQTTTTQTPVVTTPRFGDDTYVQVPLQFGFPYYGKVFTNSWMHSNGVVSFLDPAVPVQNAGYNPGQWAYCCEGVQPSGTRPEFSYMIAPLWTDLYPVATSTFRTEGTATYQKYFWNNIAEISNMNNLNTFSLEIRPTGFIGANYTQVNIQNQNVWVGTIGDPSLNQWNQIYYGRGIPAGALQNWTMDSTGDMCVSNPLSSPSCPGYTEAMCTTNPLYSTACSGYHQAYLTQQCSSNPLFNSSCPGYAAAYLTYQCSINPLYSTTCDGYEKAYHDDQCSKNALYATDCTGYAQAYHEQQCSINPLYATTCSGYAAAYFDQQCKLNGLYDQKCPNYAEAYATKSLLEQQGTASIVATAGVVAQTAPQPTVSSEGTVSTAPSTTGSATVDKAITTTTTTANSAAAPAAPVQLVQQPKMEAAPPAPPQERKADAPPPPPQGGQQGGEKPQPTARQQLAERRMEAAKRDAVEKGKNLANDMGKAADMESQKQIQNVVIQAMGFTPGFDAYQRSVVPDVVGYKPFTVYNNQVNVDNRRIGLGLYGPSDKLHNDLVDSQYKGN